MPLYYEHRKESAEGISEFENDVLKEVKNEELINHDRTLLLTKAEKVA